MENKTPLSRRSFIQAPAALAAAPALLGAQSPNDKVRVGIIGVGGRGTALLRRIVKSPGVEVTAVCDINPLAVARALSIIPNGDVQTFKEYRDLLDQKDIDAVFVATPVDLHKEMAVAALEVHKHLYLEKPMGRNPEEVKAVHQASKSSRGQLQLGFQLRFDPFRSTAVRHIRDGGIGRVIYMQGNRHTPDLPRETPWFFDASISGNGIVEQAVHIIDLMNWAADGHPLQAMGSGGINTYQDQPVGRTTFDHYVAIFEYPSNVRLNFTHIFFDPRGFTGISEKVWGSDFAIDLPSARKYELEPQARQNAPWVQLEIESPGPDMTQLAVNSFFESARNDTEPLNNAEWGKYATLTAIMGRMAIEQNRVVKWEEVDI